LLKKAKEGLKRNNIGRTPNTNRRKK